MYVGDLKLPDMHYVVFVRSPYAHARINSIDTEAARQIPGVVAVVTGHDIAPLCEPMPVATSGEGGSDNAEPTTPRTHLVLSVDKVRHVGEAVALVIATSPAIAADAAAAVEVDWEPLPIVADVFKALEPDAPRLFDDMQGNVEHVWKRKTGGVDAAFASAFKVVKQRMVNQRLSGISMEGRAVVAAPDPASGGLTIWTSTQTPHQVRGDLAKALHLSENQVRTIAPDVGGGFGIKIGIYPEEIALGALARHFNMPLRWVEDRVEHMVATTHGRGQVAEYEAAVQEDGTVTGLRIRIVADLGAYPLAPGLANLTGMMAAGVYRIPEVDIENTTVFTNTTPVAAYRGAGRPEAAYYIERMMDVIAHELGMDPADVRRKNFIAPDAFPYKTPTGITYDSGEYDRALTRALDISHYAALREEQKRRQNDPRAPLLGIGIACYVEMCGFGPYESAQVRVEPSGTVTVSTGISPHGQGTGTTFAQMVAEQLGADFETIIVKHGDTATTPMGVGTMGSRSLAIGGTALVRATAKVREKARRIAAHMLEAAVEDVEFADGQYGVKGVPGKGLTLHEIARRAYSDKLPDEIEPGLEATDFFKPPDLIYPFGAHVAVVEVDRDTGVVRIRDYYTVDDCGPRISPMLVTGQVHGGLAQGIAQALLEEIVYDENGQLLSGSLMDYAIPRASQFPDFVTDKTETRTPLNPLGAKGIGEAATIGSTPAIANAVADALQPLGVRHVDIPLRSERVWNAMQRASNKAE
jgi:carbon-monoxide dehydrogenase large subunit